MERTEQNNNPYSKMKALAASLLGRAIEHSGYKKVGGEDLLQSITPSKLIGDISSSAAFRIAKDGGGSAEDVSKKIASNIKPEGSIEKVSAENGFVNFYLRRKDFAIEVIGHALAPEDRGARKRGRAIVEYISVNPNKPWHVGHLRNALLGNTVANMYAAIGYDVTRQNYIDDLGLQVVESLWGYINLGRKPDKKFDHWLGEEYVEVNKRLSDDKVKEEIKKLLSSAERNGSEESKMLRDLSERCVKAQYETAFSFGIYQDVMVWESDIVNAGLLQKALDILSSSGAIEKPKEGKYKDCIIMNLEKINDVSEDLRGLKESAKVLIRSDGTATYVAKDIAFHMWKFGMIKDPFNYSLFLTQPGGAPLYTTSRSGAPGSGKFNNALKSINVIDATQSYPQSVLRLAFSAMGRKDVAEGIVHLAYGQVELEEGRLSGRSGNWSGFSADDLLSEAKTKARGLITERFKLSEEDRTRISEEVARSAIIFEFLKTSPEKKIIFSWSRALNFEGNSGPYCQYMHARASRIIETAESGGVDVDKIRSAYISGTADNHDYGFDSEPEFALIKRAAVLDETIEKAALELRPNMIVEYLNSLSAAFAAFYEAIPVMKAHNAEERDARLLLTYVVKETMRKALGLLGIEAIGKM